MKLSWSDSTALWWSFAWRLGLIALVCGIPIGLLAAPVADSLGAPERHADIAFWAGSILWIPSSLLSLKEAEVASASIG